MQSLVGRDLDAGENGEEATGRLGGCEDAVVMVESLDLLRVDFFLLLERLLSQTGAMPRYIAHRRAGRGRQRLDTRGNAVVHSGSLKVKLKVNRHDRCLQEMGAIRLRRSARDLSQVPAGSASSRDVYADRGGSHGSGAVAHSQCLGALRCADAVGAQPGRDAGAGHAV